MKKATELARKPRWYRMEAYFDGEAQKVCQIGDEQVYLSGGDDDLLICLAPPSITAEQGEALRKLLEANFMRSVLVLTNNIQLVKLKPVNGKVAEKIMKGGAVVHFGKDGAEQA